VKKCLKRKVCKGLSAGSNMKRQIADAARDSTLDFQGSITNSRQQRIILAILYATYGYWF
jgi:hypothetical protein